MSMIKVANLSFRYEQSSHEIFKNLNLNLDSNWKLGLVGRNGRGKTTFLRILDGKLGVEGKIESNLSFSYFPIEIEDPDDITLYELQKKTSFEPWELERELNLLQTDPNLLWQQYSSLSGGEQTKVLLALSFVDKENFPLIDEPTNHLDETSRQHVADYLKKHDKGYIVVSHDRDFLNQVTDHILAIENGEIHLYQGNYESYEDTKSKRDHFNQAKNNKLKAEISSLKQKKGDFTKWSNVIENRKGIGRRTQNVLNRRTRLNKGAIGHASQKMMSKAKNVEHRIDQGVSEKQGLINNIEAVPNLSINFQANYHSTLLELQHFGLTIAGKKLFSDLNLVVQNHGIVALEGKNGCGKSTLLKVILDQVKNANKSGSLELAQGLKISYLPQNFTEYKGNLKNFAAEQGLSYEELLNALKKMGFPRTSFSTKIEEMSMGQQKRVALAKSLVEEANLYLWDEPANYLDVFNQDQLVKLLKFQRPAMLLIEHDRYFIDQVSDKKIKIN